MLELVLGIIAMLFGFWGITRNWYLFKDIIAAVLPFVSIILGTIMLLAGIRGVKKSKDSK